MYPRPVDTEDELTRSIQAGIDALRNDDEMLQIVQFIFYDLLKWNLNIC